MKFKMDHSALPCANTQIFSRRKANEEGERPVMANYTPSLITSRSPLSSLAEKHEETTQRERARGGGVRGGGENEKEESETNVAERKSLREYLCSNITHGAPAGKGVLNKRSGQRIGYASTCTNLYLPV